MAIDIEAPGVDETALKAAVRELVFPAVDTVKTAFWADVDGVAPRIHRMRDRVFVGNAVLTNVNRTGSSTSWLVDANAGANWIPRDSQFTVMHDRGSIAVSGLTRVSDGDTTSPSPAGIGVAGYVICNSSLSRSGWALYADVQFESGVNGYGLEMAIKNKGTDRTTTPYFLTTGTYGIQLSAGGDPAYGGSPANPSNTAILINKNGHTWNRGIVFAYNALTGDDGTTGTGTAIELAKGHIISWRRPDNGAGASIYSSVNTSGGDVQQLFTNSQIFFYGTGAAPIAVLTHNASGVAYWDIRNAASGGPTLRAAGAATDIDTILQPKGAGVATTTGQFKFAASTTARASANIPTGTAPTSPGNGDMWIESNVLKIRLNGATVTVQTA